MASKLLSAYTAVIDWLVTPSSKKRRFTSKRWIALYLSPAGFALLYLTVPPISSALQLKWSALNNKELPIYVSRFRENLPSEAQVINGQIEVKCKAGDNVRFLARRYYDFSQSFTFSEIEAAFIKQNEGAFKQGRCAAGTVIRVPTPITEPLVNRPLGLPDAQPIRAVYMRGDTTTPQRLTDEVSRFGTTGANAVVFDVKDVIGVVNFRSGVPIVEELRQHQPPIPNIAKTIRFLHDRNIYVIARMALFQDENLAKKKPEIAIKDSGSPGGILLVKGHPLWVDPGRPEVQEYNLHLVQEMIALGVDEIQFDYVRYPAEGSLKNVTYYKVSKVEDKTAHLARFLEAAHFLTSGTGVRTAIDIFGIVAWGEEVDMRTTGQRIAMLAPHVDVISPMLYPSHFNNGFDGYDNPADQGFHFYSDGVRRVLEMSGDAKPIVRPWVQAFKWRVVNYNEQYILEQIRGTNAAGGVGWMMWNAGNDYALVYKALANGRGLAATVVSAAREAREKVTEKVTGKTPAKPATIASAQKPAGKDGKPAEAGTKPEEAKKAPSGEEDHGTDDPDRLRKEKAEHDAKAAELPIETAPTGPEVAPESAPNS